MFFKTMSDVLDINVSPIPHIAIFGKAPDDLYLTKIQNNVLAFSSLVARKRILLLEISASHHQSKSGYRIA